jgi:hypothetical protein
MDGRLRSLAGVHGPVDVDLRRDGPPGSRVKLDPVGAIPFLPNPHEWVAGARTRRVGNRRPAPVRRARSPGAGGERVASQGNGSLASHDGSPLSRMPPCSSAAIAPRSARPAGAEQGCRSSRAAKGGGPPGERGVGEPPRTVGDRARARAGVWAQSGAHAESPLEPQKMATGERPLPPAAAVQMRKQEIREPDIREPGIRAPDIRIREPDIREPDIRESGGNTWRRLEPSRTSVR